MTYTFNGPKGQETIVSAPNEALARRRAMIARWGSVPDAVTPEAPNYQGLGLSLISIKR